MRQIPDGGRPEDVVKRILGVQSDEPVADLIMTLDSQAYPLDVSTHGNAELP